MSQPQSREIRVFLSSTFRDMEAERAHLIKTIFPACGRRAGHGRWALPRSTCAGV
jgi:hypothetical protein